MLNDLGREHGETLEKHENLLSRLDDSVLYIVKT